jgi:hypothetical protein
MAVQQMGSTNIYASVLGVKFADGTTQNTAATGAGPTFNITNGNAGSFYLPLLPNSTAPFGVQIWDAPGGYFSVQADAGAGVGVGGNLTLLAPSFTANPQSYFGLFSGINDNIQGGSVVPGIEISASSGPLVLRNGSSQDIQISHGSGANGVKLDWATNTLMPLGTGHLMADEIIGGVLLSSTPPTVGQVLTASSGVAAGWATPAGGSLNYKTVRSAPTSFTQGGVVGPIAMSFATPFVDNNYTVQVTVLGDEVAPGTPTVTQFPSVGVSYIAFQSVSGAGVNVWIANNDSIAHTGVIHVVAIHD